MAVTDRVTIVGTSSGLSTTTRQDNEATKGGDAGHIHIRAATLEIRDNGRIHARNRGGSGHAGTIRIDVDELGLSDRGEISASARRGHGNAGTVIITATHRVDILDDDSGISVDSGGTGHAGQIRIEAPTVAMRSGGVIRARTEQHGHAGTITVRADHVELLEGAQIDASALRNSEGQAGEIAIEADRISIAGPDSGVAATTRGTGHAGQIEILAGTLALTESAQISAAVLRPSEGASGGTVRIVASDTVLITGDGVAGRLPTNISDVRLDEGISATTWARATRAT